MNQNLNSLVRCPTIAKGHVLSLPLPGTKGMRPVCGVSVHGVDNGAAPACSWRRGERSASSDGTRSVVSGLHNVHVSRLFVVVRYSGHVRTTAGLRSFDRRRVVVVWF